MADPRLLCRALGVLLALAWLSGMAAPRALIDRNPVRLGETLRLIVEFDEALDARGFDPSPLTADFEVLGTSSSSRMDVVNGSRQIQSQLVIELAPRRGGELTIPALKFPAGTTAPLLLRVLPAGSGAAAGEVFLEVEADPTSTWVQAPVELVVRLYLALPLLEGRIADPEPEEALVQRRGEDSRYSVERDGVRFGVIERRFTVFPQRSGELEIPPVVFDGRAVSDGQEGFGGLFRQGRRLRARSESLSLDVAPPPPEAAGAPWLPARDVKLTESWPDDPPVFVVGKPVTRTFRVEATGVPGEHIPELSPAAVDGIRAYPDKAVIDTAVRRDALVGIREQRVAMVPARAGFFDLPAIELDWWDTAGRRMRTARIPRRTIEILPTAATHASPTAELAAPTPREAAGGGERVRGEGAAAAPVVGWSTVFAVLLWLATLGLWWRDRCARGRRRGVDGDLEHRPPSMSALHAACRSEDAPRIRGELVAWSRLYWPERPPRGLEDVARRLGDPALAEALREVDAACYAALGGRVDGARLWRRLQPALKSPPSRSRSAAPGLPPLYPGTPHPEQAG